MDDKIRKNILDVLQAALRDIQKGDIKGLKDLSNMTIHTASIVQDHDSISIAVLIYSLAKMFERSRYQAHHGWFSFCKECVSKLEKAYEELEHGEDDAFEETIRLYLEDINKLDIKLKDYIHDVLLKARITKGSRIYEHGISMERTAHLLGISQYELMNYTGQTHIADMRIKVLVPARERMNTARGLFNG